MSQKWNLQDIRPSRPHKKRSRLISKGQAVIETHKADFNSATDHIVIGSPWRRFLLIVVGLFLITITILLVNILATGAKVIVSPLAEEVNVQAVFKAQKEPGLDVLSYEIMTLEDSTEKQVTASGKEQVSEQATGEIIIYKTTPGAQPLIKSTRFESSDGLIFKLFESVTVPGGALGESGEPVPGSVKVKVFGESVGEQYNLPPTKFTVPGLASDSKLVKSISAVSETEFTGGFDGENLVLDEAELNTIKEELEKDLRRSLLARAGREKPAGFIFFDSAALFDFELLPVTVADYDDKLVTIKQKATLKAPLFRADQFASFIAAATIQDYQQREAVRINDYSELFFAYEQPIKEGVGISLPEELSFRLTGKPLIVWTYDEERLKADLVGISRTALDNQNGMISTYPAIKSVTARVRPFWRQSFPIEIDKIEIIERL